MLTEVAVLQLIALGVLITERVFSWALKIKHSACCCCDVDRQVDRSQST